MFLECVGTSHLQCDAQSLQPDGKEIQGKERHVSWREPVASIQPIEDVTSPEREQIDVSDSDGGDDLLLTPEKLIGSPEIGQIDTDSDDGDDLPSSSMLDKAQEAPPVDHKFQQTKKEGQETQHRSDQSEPEKQE